MAPIPGNHYIGQFVKLNAGWEARHSHPGELSRLGFHEMECHLALTFPEILCLLLPPMEQQISECSQKCQWGQHR